MRPSPAMLLRLAILLAAASPASAQGAARAEGCGATVTVAVGDTLTSIAARCGVAPGALLEANPQIADPDIVPLGMRLAVPGGGGTGGLVVEEPPIDGGGAPPIRVVAIGGPLDARVRLFATNLPPGAEALIGCGASAAAPLFFTRARVDATGVLSVELALPGWALRTGAAHLVVETPIGGAMLRAAPYRLAGPSP